MSPHAYAIAILVVIVVALLVLRSVEETKALADQITLPVGLVAVGFGLGAAFVGGCFAGHKGGDDAADVWGAPLLADAAPAQSTGDKLSDFMQ